MSLVITFECFSLHRLNEKSKSGSLILRSAYALECEKLKKNQLYGELLPERTMHGNESLEKPWHVSCSTVIRELPRLHASSFFSILSLRIISMTRHILFLWLATYTVYVLYLISNKPGARIRGETARGRGVSHASGWVPELIRERVKVIWLAPIPTWLPRGCLAL